MCQIGNLENRIGRAGLLPLAQLVAHRYPASQLSALPSRSRDGTERRNPLRNELSCVTANFIARECGYHLEGSWEDGQSAVEAYFRPPETFEMRFDALLAEVREMGFTAVDIWMAHLNPAWATPGQMSAARRCLERQGLRPVSVAGYFGSTLQEFEAVCRLATGLGAPILGGVAPVLGRESEGVIALLRAQQTRVGDRKPVPWECQTAAGGDRQWPGRAGGGLRGYRLVCHARLRRGPGHRGTWRPRAARSFPRRRTYGQR